MSNLTNPELIDFLACPNCKGDLIETGFQLECISCHKEYEITRGIPVLFATSVSIEHLREEENLAEMMKRQPITHKEQFSLHQWTLSKEEFWGMVKEKIDPAPKSIINIGCGYDLNFRQFKQSGYTFINFDIVYDTLYTLQNEYRAKSCVAGDMSKLPFKNRSFDYVVCIDVLHHESDNITNILESFRDLLKPGGLLFLEDLNAWAMFQMAKSILLPKPVYKTLRVVYHKLKHSASRPADYEFPTSVWRVKAILEKLHFHNIKIHPNDAYPCIGEARYRVYELFKKSEFIRKYNNYHYMLSAQRH